LNGPGEDRKIVLILQQETNVPDRPYIIYNIKLISSVCIGHANKI